MQEKLPNECEADEVDSQCLRLHILWHRCRVGSPCPTAKNNLYTIIHPRAIACPVLLQLRLCHRSQCSLANRQVAATRSGRFICHRQRSHRSPTRDFWCQKSPKTQGASKYVTQIPVAVPEAAIGLSLVLGCLRPLPLAQVASSATGSAPIAPLRGTRRASLTLSRLRRHLRY